MILTRRTALQAGAAALAASVARPARAQAYPSRTITLVVPFTPGGTTDILARLLGEKLKDSLGQSVVIENRPGAGGSTGAAAVARAAPDGHTLLLAHIGTLAVNPGFYPSLPYDPLRSFAFVSMLARVHNVLAVPPGLPVASVAELVAYAKARPNELNYASGGNGSAAHIAMEAFADAAGLKLQHVPYRGTAPAVQDLLGGRVQLILTGAPVVLPLVRNGQLKGLGVSGLARIADAPELPTIAEAAPLPGFEASQWYGLVAPAGTPEAVVARLTEATHAAMALPEVERALSPQGADIWTTSPAAFRAHVEREIPRWGSLISRAGLKP
jgi:tripartite-type tricarboxylate transporter receptor subunit TctC